MAAFSLIALALLAVYLVLSWQGPQSGAGHASRYRVTAPDDVEDSRD